MMRFNTSNEIASTQDIAAVNGNYVHPDQIVMDFRQYKVYVKGSESDGNNRNTDRK